MTDLLATYSPADLKATPEDAIQPAPPGPKVKADQADLFNTQGALFAHVRQPGELE